MNSSDNIDRNASGRADTRVIADRKRADGLSLGAVRTLIIAARKVGFATCPTNVPR